VLQLQGNQRQQQQQQHTAELLQPTKKKKNFNKLSFFKEHNKACQTETSSMLHWYSAGNFHHFNSSQSSTILANVANLVARASVSSIGCQERILINSTATRIKTY
jgi:hypothetical protein